MKTWPHFRRAITLESLGIMTVLALLANLCYRAAYLAEVLVQKRHQPSGVEPPTLGRLGRRYAAGDPFRK